MHYADLSTLRIELPIMCRAYLVSPERGVGLDHEKRGISYSLVVMEGYLSYLHFASFLEIVSWGIDDSEIILLIAYGGIRKIEAVHQPKLYTFYGISFHELCTVHYQVLRYIIPLHPLAHSQVDVS